MPRVPLIRYYDRMSPERGEDWDDKERQPTTSLPTASPPTASLHDAPVFATSELRPGERIADRYIVVQFIARGGMGEVYEAIDEHLQGKRIALKTLRAEIAADPEMQARFEREVLVAREISHRAICPTWDLIRARGPRGPVLCLSMKLLRGESLSARLRRAGPIPPENALPIALQLAAGLDAAHEAGVIHRDFKPGNVIVEGQGQGAVATITDFGLSRIYDSDLTIGAIGRVAGTPGYMAPELFEGRTASPAGDVYAFGVVLYEMLAGQRPPGRGTSADLSALAAPDAWKRAIAGCLHPDPRERFQSAGEAIALLESPTAKRARAYAVRQSTRRRWIRGGLTAAGVAFAAAIAMMIPRVGDMLHPLPRHRFVALGPAADSAPAQSALAGSILEGVHDRLVRSESRMKDLLIAGPAELAQQKADPDAIGANLLLTVSLDVWGKAATLKLIDLRSNKVLRERGVAVDRARGNGVVDAAAVTAAEMLGISGIPDRLRDEDELAALPATVYPIYMAAEELRRQPNDGGLDAAIEKYQRVLEAAPSFALGYARIAQAYTRRYQLGHDPAALEIAERNAERAVRQNPESPGAVLSQALIYLYTGRTAEALGALRRVQQLDPGNPEVLFYEATAYRDSNRLSDEEATYRLLIRQRPNYYRAYNGLGMALRREGRNEESAAAFREATQIAPRQSLLWSNLGMAYLLLGRKADAEAAFHASLDRAPSELAWLNLGNIAFEDADYRTALEDYQKARNLRPSDDLAWRNIADCEAVLGNRKGMLDNYAKAAGVLGELLHTNPKPGSGWMTMAFYQAKLGHGREAEAALRKAEEAGASSVQDQFVRAQTLAVLGRKAEAIEVLSDCVRRGLSQVEIGLALDLKEIREDPAWRSRTGNRAAAQGAAPSQKSADGKEIPR
jgi:tetratricopeptide (TPR) repeat protein/tRNA A-37 threonylcarbamoyl transferase component Bud32